MEKNYGLDVAKLRTELDGSEWNLGAVPTCIFAVPEHERKNYLPIGEVQRSDIEDMMDCVARGYLNILETKFNYALRNELLHSDNVNWLFENGYIVEHNGKDYVEFADAFTAIKSNTTRQGNSLKAPVDAIYRYGLAPKSKLPLLKTMTWEQYHEPKRITKEIESITDEFKQRFPTNYAQVRNSEFGEAATRGSLNVALWAWPFPTNGVYEPRDGAFNHAVDVFEFTNYYFAFDNYIDTHDGDYIKKLSPSYKFWDWGYHVVVSAQKTELQVLNENPLWKQTLDVLSKILNDLAEWLKKKETESVVPVEPPKLMKAELVYEAAFAAIGQDLSKEAPDERGCAEAVSRVLKKVYPNFPIFVSTIQLNNYLRTQGEFVSSANPIAGCIAIFPTEGTRIGHVGIWGRRGWVMSNNSFGGDRGKWTANYTEYGFREEAKKRGLKLYYYIPQ